MVARLALLLCVFAAALWSRPSTAVGGAADAFEARVERSASRDSECLIRDVLGAGGCTTDEAGRALSGFRELAERFDATQRPQDDEHSQAQAVHRFIHREVLLGRYDARGSDLAATLRGGSFNCATATALFLALAGRSNLDAHAVAVTGHVWCRVIAGSGSFDVETTCPTWFELVQSEASSKPAAGAMAEHRARAAHARVLDGQALVAIFHFNRGVSLLRAEQFESAAEANLAALRLDPKCQGAYENLLATVNDWSLALAARGRRSEALTLLGEGMALAPHYDPFRVNYRYVSEPSPANPSAAAVGDSPGEAR